MSNAIRYFPLIMWTTLLGVSVSTVASATEPAADFANNAVPRVIPITHTIAGEVARTIQELGLRVRAAAPTPDRLVLFGTDADIEQVIRQVVAPLNQPATAAGSTPQTEYLKLGNLPAATLGGMISAVVRSRATRHAIDHANNMLVVSADAEDLAAIRELIHRLQRPVHTLTAQFYFVRASFANTDPNPSAQLPEALSSVATALEAAGFSRLDLLAPMSVVAFEEQRFSLESTRRDNLLEKGVELLKFQVKGTGRMLNDSGHVHLEVQAAVHGSTASGEGKGIPTQYEIDTTIVAPLGQFVVLAAAPGSTADGDAIAVVVRVTREGA